jgi:hypothetical protein
MDSLPDDVLAIIFDSLPWQDRLRWRDVCLRWRGIMHNAAMWRSMPRICAVQVIRQACLADDMATAQYLIGRFGFDPYDGQWLLRITEWFRSKTYGETMLFEPFDWACILGDLDVAKWFARHLETKLADIRATGNLALIYASGEGHLAVVQWLVSTFGLGPDDARTYQCAALRFACKGGHLATAQWLVSTFGLGLDDVRAEMSYAVNFAAQNQHRDVVEWLSTTFGVREGSIW